MYISPIMRLEVILNLVTYIGRKSTYTFKRCLTLWHTLAPMAKIDHTRSLEIGMCALVLNI